MTSHGSAKVKRADSNETDREKPEEDADGSEDRAEKDAKNAQERARARREGQRVSADVGRTQTSRIIYTGKK